ncbi:Mu transposase domain-containing protein [Glutamicibacter mysorens]
MITLEDWALIRRLVKDGVPKSRIARDLGISRTTVVKAAASTTPPKYERKQQATAFAPYEDAVRRLLKETPTMPSTVIAERIGWTGSVRTIRRSPMELLDTDREAMLPLPPAVFDLGWRHQVRLPRDYYVRVATCDYSVAPQAIGRMVDVSADLERVKVRCGGKLMADHPRAWAKHLTVTDPQHVAAVALLRQAFQARAGRQEQEESLVRDLSVCDRAFGLHQIVGFGA